MDWLCVEKAGGVLTGAICHATYVTLPVYWDPVEVEKHADLFVANCLQKCVSFRLIP
jgi:hypothetical protein